MLLSLLLCSHTEGAVQLFGRGGGEVGVAGEAGEELLAGWRECPCTQAHTKQAIRNDMLKPFPQSLPPDLWEESLNLFVVGLADLMHILQCGCCVMGLVMDSLNQLMSCVLQDLLFVSLSDGGDASRRNTSE